MGLSLSLLSAAGTFKGSKFLRHPIRLTTAEALTFEPCLQSWLAQVCRVPGGHTVGTGLLAVALATAAYRQRHPLTVAGAIAGGAMSIGFVALINFAVDSDLKWLLLGAAMVWALSLLALTAEGWVAQSARASISSKSRKLDP